MLQRANKDALRWLSLHLDWGQHWEIDRNHNSFWKESCSILDITLQCTGLVALSLHKLELRPDPDSTFDPTPEVFHRLERIGHLQHLTSLVLIGESARPSPQLHPLPRSWRCLTNLRKLKLEGIPSLGDIAAVSYLTGLEELYLLRCETPALPETISNLTSLKVLYINPCGTSISVIPDSIGDLLSLQKLSLMGLSSLTSLPPSIGQLQQLQSLDLSACHQLTSLPETFTQLRSLRLLDERGNVRILDNLQAVQQRMPNLEIKKSNLGHTPWGIW
jgi:Leucine-rich repeat (LRR) protein